MIKLFKWMLGMHHHEYTLIEKRDIITEGGRIRGVMYVSQCAECGKIKTQKVYADE